MPKPILAVIVAVFGFLCLAYASTHILNSDGGAPDANVSSEGSDRRGDLDRLMVKVDQDRISPEVERHINPTYPMPIIPVDPDIDYSLRVIPVDPNINYTLLVITPPSQTVFSDSAPPSEMPKRNSDVIESLIIFSGGNPTIFEASSNNPIQFDSDAEGGFARILSTTSDAGARALVGPDLAERFAGRTIRLTMLARSSPENSAPSIRFAYQSGLAVSHWQSVVLSGNYGSYGMIWRVPAAHKGPIGDFILIEPGIPGDGTSIDIRSIKIDILAS